MQCPSCGQLFDGHHDVTQCQIDKQFLALGVSNQLPRPKPRFDVTVVSAGAHNKIADLEQAMQLLLVAPTEADKDSAYTYLNATREALYKHIAALEARLNVKRTVIKRF